MGDLNMNLRETNPSLSDKEEEDFRKMIDALVNEAPYIGGHSTKAQLPQEIPWFDEQKFEAGRKFYNDYYFIIMVTHFIQALMIGMAKSFISVIFRNHSYTPENRWLERVFGFFQRVSQWQFGDLMDPRSQGMKGVKLSRGQHDRIIRNMKPEHGCLPLIVPEDCHVLAKDIRECFKDHKVKKFPPGLFDYHPSVPFNQFTIASVLFGQVNAPWLSQDIYNKVPLEGLKSYTYWWGVISHLIGLKDEFNLALKPSREFYQALFEEIGIITIKEIDPTGAFLVKGALERFLPVRILGLRGVLYTTIKQVGGDAGKFWGTLTLWEKMTTKMSEFLMCLYLRVLPVRIIMNYVTYMFFQISFYWYVELATKPQKKEFLS